MSDENKKIEDESLSPSPAEDAHEGETYDDFFDEEPETAPEEPADDAEWEAMPGNRESIKDKMAKVKKKIKKKAKNSKSLSRFKIPALIVLGALAAAFLVVYIFCIVTLPKDTVAHNVMVEALDVGGLSYDETLASVKATYLFETQDITIECGGKTKTLDGRELDLRATPEATAQKAFYYGKSGNILLDGLTAMRLLVAKKTIVPVAEVNHDVLNEKLGEFGVEVCGQLTQTSVDFTETEAIITPGRSGFDYNTDTAREEILKAVDSEKFKNVHVTLKSKKPDTVDVDYIDTAIYRDPIDAYYDIKGNDIMVIAEVEGRYCNRADIEAIMDKITDGGEPIAIPYSKVIPKVKAAELQEKLFANRLGSYATNYATGGNRGLNVARAAELINGTVLAPGDVFSFNETVGDRTKENGFYSAPEYVSGQSVIGIGGGTCQVSSTLYNAALYADMGIVDRTEHMMKVGYVTAGQDATVAYGSVDFKFRNSSDYPVKISATTGGGTVTVAIIGTAWEPEREVKIKHTTQMAGDHTLVYSKRLVYSNDELIAEDTLDSSDYAPHLPAGN